jgi:hypothetical protein
MTLFNISAPFNFTIFFLFVKISKCLFKKNENSKTILKILVTHGHAMGESLSRESKAFFFFFKKKKGHFKKKKKKKEGEIKIGLNMGYRQCKILTLRL